MNKVPSNATIVLVHAAWADASSWSAVIGPLLKAGIKVIAAQIPMTSLSDDVAALKVALERAGAGPILLVSHSYSGAVITALESDDRVRGSSICGSHAPRRGRNSGGLVLSRASTRKSSPSGIRQSWSLMDVGGRNEKCGRPPSHDGANRNHDGNATPDSDEVSWRSHTDAIMEDEAVVVSSGRRRPYVQREDTTFRRRPHGCTGPFTRCRSCSSDLGTYCRHRFCVGSSRCAALSNR